MNLTRKHRNSPKPTHNQTDFRPKWDLSKLAQTEYHPHRNPPEELSGEGLCLCAFIEPIARNCRGLEISISVSSLDIAFALEFAYLVSEGSNSKPHRVTLTLFFRIFWCHSWLGAISHFHGDQEGENAYASQIRITLVYVLFSLLQCKLSPRESLMMTTEETTRRRRR
jgi:hypothetical protein